VKVIITGVAGFIGSHTAASFLSKGHTVVGIDNMSRAGSWENLEWLKEQGEEFQFYTASCRLPSSMLVVFGEHHDAQIVIHEAGQVAVTKSIQSPQTDFQANALGTLNVLEATRLYCPGATFLFASTNKVYGSLLYGPQLFEAQTHYKICSSWLAFEGYNELTPLDFHTPYGCSKGCADQYVRDYHRIYGLKTVVFRQSCIYGTRQYGKEDQGWVAWLTIASLLNLPITIYGNGKQVRDLLWIDDLVNLYHKAIERIDVAAGQVYNVGGGMANSISILELLDRNSSNGDGKPRLTYAPARLGDQRLFVADCGKAQRELGWSPQVGLDEGLQKLTEWVLKNKDHIRKVLGTALL
jgi:CDP-paratose 2-epimerase